MPARTGKEVIDRLKNRPPNLWLEGELVEDPTSHPRTHNAVRSLAALYDLQYRDDLVDIMTVKSPSSGDLWVEASSSRKAKTIYVSDPKCTKSGPTPAWVIWAARPTT